MNLRSKKGELTTKQIVTIIILIVSFAIILFFLFKLNLGSESEKEICHNSVVMGSSDLVSTTGAVPMNCQTSYVCITKKGGCNAMLKPRVIKVDSEDEVYEALASELADCWWMFGEGKINYAGSDLIKEMYCARCSQVLIDESVKEINGFESGNFSVEKLYKYLARTKMPSKNITYSQYLYDTNNYYDFLRVNSSSRVYFSNITLGQQYSVVTGMTSETSTWSWVGIGAGAVVFGALTGGAGFAAIAVAAVAGGGAGYYLLAPIADNIFGGQTIKPVLVRSGRDEIKKLGCAEIVTKS